MSLSKNLEDNPLNRAKVYITKCYDVFTGSVLYTQAVALDKRNANSKHTQQAANFLQGAGAFAGAILAAGMEMPGGGEVAGAITAGVSAPVTWFINKIEQRKAHKKEKERAKFFTGFQRDDPEWQALLFRAFLTIFIKFNLQFYYMTKECTDDWAILMQRIAIYSVQRIFTGLKDQKQEPEMNEQLITSAFVNGRRSGDDIKLKDNDLTMKKLIESPAVRRADDKVIEGKFLASEAQELHSDKYLYRREFNHEKKMTAKEILGREAKTHPTVNAFDRKYGNFKPSNVDVHDTLVNDFETIVCNITKAMQPLPEITDLLVDFQKEVKLRIKINGLITPILPGYPVERGSQRKA
jgi:hypothetical protein